MKQYLSIRNREYVLKAVSTVRIIIDTVSVIHGNESRNVQVVVQKLLACHFQLKKWKTYHKDLQKLILINVNITISSDGNWLLVRIQDPTSFPAPPGSSEHEKAEA